MQLAPLFDRFARAAQGQIGAHHIADQICASRRIPSPAGSKVKDGFTTGCGGETLYALPVTGDEGGDFKKPDPCTVCVVDDRAYDFPRYGGRAPS